MTRDYRKTAWSILACLICVASAWAQATADPFAEVPPYKFGQPKTALLAIEAQIRTAQPADLRAIEAKLLGILQAPAATTDAKDWACRQLRQVGSESAVAVLAAQLTNKDLATAARMALQSIPGAKVDAALRAALAKVEGEVKAGVIQTLGVRGDQTAVPLLAPLAGDPDPIVTEAALYALGQIGGAEALRALEAAQVPAGLQRYRFHAILLCAERLAAAGQAAQAGALYVTVYQQAQDAVIKTAALRGAVATDPAKAAPALAAALKNDQAKLRLAAAKFTCELGSGEALRSVLAELPSLPVDAQTAVLSLVKDRAALPAVLAAVNSSDEACRVAALGALGRVGDAASVKLLLSVAAIPPAEPQAAARRSLQELRGPEVDATVLAATQQGEPALRLEAIRATAARGAVTAVPTLLTLATAGDQALQTESLAALALLADAKALPALVKLLVEAQTDSQKAAADAAVVATCRRLEDKEAAAAAVLAALPGSSVTARGALLHVAARVPSAKSLAALRAAAADAEASVQDAAIRGLAAWPDSAAVADLCDIARSAKSQVHKVLALRGVIRLAALPGVRPVDQSIKLLADALALATRVEEKKLVLAALGELNHAAALELASSCLTEKELEVEAATTVVKIAQKVQVTKPDAAGAAIKKILEVCQAPAARQAAESAMIVVGDMVNIAPQGTASSPDDLEKDGAAGGDQAAIDGDPATYWDEQDNQKLYRFVVTFKQAEKIGALSILGYAHHNFAPKDFEILCDNKVVKKIENAQYTENFLVIRLDEVSCQTVELKITGYYGSSPAIRELGIYRPAPKR